MENFNVQESIQKANDIIDSCMLPEQLGIAENYLEFLNALLKNDEIYKGLFDKLQKKKQELNNNRVE